MTYRRGSEQHIVLLHIGFIMQHRTSLYYTPMLIPRYPGSDITMTTDIQDVTFVKSVNRQVIRTKGDS